MNSITKCKFNKGNYNYNSANCFLKSKKLNFSVLIRITSTLDCTCWYLEVTLTLNLTSSLLSVFQCQWVKQRSCRTQNKHDIYFVFFFHAPTAPSWPGPPHYRGFTITHRHTTLSRTPLDEWSARHTELYLAINNTQKRQRAILWRDSNPQSQQANGRRAKP
jgi:hypothetical protein